MFKRRTKNTITIVAGKEYAVAIDRVMNKDYDMCSSVLCVQTNLINNQVYTTFVSRLNAGEVTRILERWLACESVITMGNTIVVVSRKRES